RASRDEPQGGVSAFPFIKETYLIVQLYQRILQVARQEKVDLIHAHSPSLNGLPSYAATRRLDIPVVYEMRSLWEEGPEDQKRTLFDRLKFVTSRWIETRL